MMEKLMKAYVIKEAVEFAAKDARKFLKKRLKNIDADALLNHVGLTTYRPAKATMGGASLFLFGAAVGGLAALILAPKAGTELRSDLMNKFNAAKDPAQASAPSNSVRIDAPPMARV